MFGRSRETVLKMCRFSIPPGYRSSKPVENPKQDPLVLVLDASSDVDRAGCLSLTWINNRRAKREDLSRLYCSTTIDRHLFRRCPKRDSRFLQQAVDPGAGHELYRESPVRRNRDR